MARITRSRQEPALKLEAKTFRSCATANTIVENDAKERSKAKPSTKRALIEDENIVPIKKGKISNVKANTKKTVIQNENSAPTTKGKNSNSKSGIKKSMIQDENALASVNKNKTNIKTSQSKISVLGSKLHLTRKNNTSDQRSSILALKSPVLRNRTNTSNEQVRSDTSAKKDIQLIENKKITKTVKKLSKKNNNKNEGESQETIKKYIFKQPAIKNKKITEENIMKNKDSVPNSNKNENICNQVHSAKSPSNAVKSEKNNNLSKKAIEELLNQEDKLPEIKNKDLNENKSAEENIPMELDDTDAQNNEKEDNKITKKFFKHKIEIKTISINPMNRKNPKRLAANRKKITATKKLINSDNTFSPKIKEQRKSTKPAAKKLRSQAAKNYCEVSKISQDSKSFVTEIDKKSVPIYKTTETSQENNKAKKEIYEFPDDSQESGVKVKKQKRVVKKPTTKRVRKAAILPATTSQKIKNKPTGKVQLKKVQFKEQEKEKQPITEPKQDAKDSVYTNIEIPEDLQNAGDSTIAEAPTIKITSDTRLEGSQKINLMTTPSAPKTINSALKLFGPKNAITSQPKAQYSNMVNHSLIRQSMSPIRKEIDSFDIGSPWRPIDAFSRVQKVVQSTPQINKVLAGRERIPSIQMNLNKRSICSEDTIHLSSIENEKLSNQKSIDDLTQTQENVSPRKFGTVLSNLNSIETNSNRKQASLQDKLQSPLKAILPPASFESNENDQEMQDDVTPILTTLNKEGKKIPNKVSSPNKSSEKKIQTPSPFRFDKMRSSKRIAAIGCQSYAENSNSLKENKDPNAVAGPSNPAKSKSVNLRQSNLNNFLNLDEMPESSHIFTPHGIFDDIHSTPINEKKSQKMFEEPNIENAFGFDDCDFSEEISDIAKTSGPMIATAKDVAKSVKGKLFPNARVKSKRISQNNAKETMLKNVLKKNVTESQTPEHKENQENKNVENNENKNENKNDNLKDLENNNEPLDPKKILLKAVSFSDTFDVFSENGEDLSTKVPDEIPLFVDLQPVHFTQPPRRSYNKRKKAVCFNTSKDESENEENDDYEKPKKKRKKESRLSREEQKRLQDWVKFTNESFKEIDHFDLVVE